MRWSVVSLIARREIRDLLRDRRSVFLVVILPIILYPLFGLASYAMALKLKGQTTKVGVVGMSELPSGKENGVGQPLIPYPPLIVDGSFPREILPEASFDAGESQPEIGSIVIAPCEGDPQQALTEKKFDVILIIPPGFATEIGKTEVPTLTIDARDGDEKSKLAAKRLTAIVRNWEIKLREVKFQRAGLPKTFDRVFKLEDPQSKKPTTKKAADEIRDVLVRVFPFILIMWLLAGAIQPAVDLTAGEKERGTMETLLISPTERTEIVGGKFFAVTIFAFCTVFWNVLWLTGGTIALERLLGFPIVNLSGMAACLLLAVPLAMFFSAICLALGVFARSTKEGQYYLMPLFLVAMPLSFWSIMPGSELSLSNAWVPLSGAMMLQRQLMSVTNEPLDFTLILVVVGCLGVYVLLALWLAVRQFQRESVLFRESGDEKKGLAGFFSEH